MLLWLNLQCKWTLPGYLSCRHVAVFSQDHLEANSLKDCSFFFFFRSYRLFCLSLCIRFCKCYFWKYECRRRWKKKSCKTRSEVVFADYICKLLVIVCLYMYTHKYIYVYPVYIQYIYEMKWSDTVALLWRCALNTSCSFSRSAADLPVTLKFTNG